MPPVRCGKHLVDILFELGPVKAESAIEPGDLPGWEHVMGVEFDPWEMRVLIQLSRAYHTEMHAAKEWGREPPYRGVANQWKWVRKKQSERNVKQIKAVAQAEAAERATKEKRRNGDRQ